MSRRILYAQKLPVQSQCQLMITWTHRVMRRPVGTYGRWTKFPECCIIATHILFRWARQDKVGEAGPSRTVPWIFIIEPSAHCSGLCYSQSASSEGGISQRLTNDESLPEATPRRVSQWLKSFFPPGQKCIKYVNCKSQIPIKSVKYTSGLFF